MKGLLGKADLQVVFASIGGSLVEHHVVVVHEQVAQVPHVIFGVDRLENWDVARVVRGTNQVASDHEVSERDVDLVLGVRRTNHELDAVAMVLNAGACLLEGASTLNIGVANHVGVDLSKNSSPLLEVASRQVHVGQLGLDNDGPLFIAEVDPPLADDGGVESDLPAIDAPGVDGLESIALGNGRLVPAAELDAAIQVGVDRGEEAHNWV
mmetsp:Transcript_8843/g.13630  ORF Transcript_8843/g.13630 Transcript_8843/m.13630 type:complete len:210 (+) Transcript_8843:252-881(+)